MRVVVRPKKNIQMESQTWGLSFFIMMLAGISAIMYGTKNTVRAVLYLFPVRLRSSTIENSFAFEMLTLHIKKVSYLRSEKKSLYGKSNTCPRTPTSTECKAWEQDGRRSST